MRTSSALSRHSGLDPESVNTALAERHAAVFMDSGFRRNDELSLSGGEHND
jgi:hypothetical protein